MRWCRYKCANCHEIVPNVYNSLQSSFLSLAWPWPGRWLPKGNQWEWWDPQQGPLPGFGEVGHSPRGTNGSTGAQCVWVPSPPATPMPSSDPLHPYAPIPLLVWVPTLHASPQSTPEPLHPLTAPIPLMAPDTSYTPKSPLMPQIPILAPEYLHALLAPQCTPDTPTPLMAPWCPWHPYTHRSPWCHLYPCWHLSTYTPCQPPHASDTPTSPDGSKHPWHPLRAPDATYTLVGTWELTLPASLPIQSWWSQSPCWPLTPPTLPRSHLMPLILMLAPEDLHSLPSPNAPLTPPTPPTPPDSCPFPLTATWYLLHPLGAPWCHLYLSWPLSAYTPCQPPTPLTSLHPLRVPWC